MAQISQDKWWQGGVKLAFELSGWLVAPLLAAFLVGKWLDNYYGTAPWLFLGCTAVAFVATCAGIVFETAKFMRDISKTDQGPTVEKENKLNDKTKFKNTRSILD